LCLAKRDAAAATMMTTRTPGRTITSRRMGARG